MYQRKKVEQYQNAIANLMACGKDYISQKEFIELTGTKPNADIAHVSEEYVLSDELCDHRGYEHGTKGVRYSYEAKSCIQYFRDRL